MGPCNLRQVEERLGPASQSLDALLAEGHAGSFDLAFIGAPAARRLGSQVLATCDTQVPGGPVFMLQQLPLASCLEETELC